MFQPLSSETQLLPPVISLLCFITICVLTVFMLWSMWRAAGIGFATIKRLHQIQCSNCRFFTGDYRLKCTIHPIFALTEEAINCSDFCVKNKPVQKPFFSNFSRRK
nr:hypothetical protein [Tolypothrix bouteillei]